MLHFFPSLGWQHLQDGSKLFQVGFDSTVLDHETEEPLGRYTEGAFGLVEPNVALSQGLKGFLEACYMILYLSTFYQHIINTHLDIVANMVFKDFVDKMLVYGPCTFQVKEHHFIVVKPLVCGKGYFFFII